MTKEVKPYKSHKPGSRKGEVHRVFDAKGADAATELGLKLKLKPGTLRSWFGTWSRGKAAAKAKSAKKTAPKKGSAPAKKSVSPMRRRAPISNRSEHRLAA